MPRSALYALVILGLVLGPVAAQTTPTVVTVSEGTNIAAALSPDGQTIAIDLQGTLWTLPAGGGEAVAITDELFDARQPAWSPDGKRIVFQSYRDGNWHIWSIGRDGSDPRQHTFGPWDDREPHWSPDGARIAFSSDRSANYDIWTLEIASGALVRLTVEATDQYGPTWSPDGGMIAFAAAGTAGSTEGGIWTRAANGTRRQIATARGAAPPAWSPDGGRLLFASVSGGEARLILMDADREAGDEATPVLQSAAGADVFPFRPSWVSDEEYIYTSDGRIQRGSVASSGAGPVTAELVEFEATFAFTRPPYERRPREFDSVRPNPVLGILGPAVSPDGRRVAFTALGDLWLLEVGDPQPRRLTDDPFVEKYATWSGDESLVFSSDRAGSLDLWVRDLETGLDRRLTDDPGSEVYAVASPDGSRIVYNTVQGLGGDLRIVDTASGESRVLRNDLFAPSRVSWGPDGSTVAMSVLQRYSGRFREGRNEILLLDVDTGESEQWTPMPHSEIGNRGLDGPVWSPDGRWMAYTSDGVLWAMEVDASGRSISPPDRLTDHSADGLSWTGDSRSIFYVTPGGLRRVQLRDDRVEEIPFDLTWTRLQPTGSLVVHAARAWDGASEEATEGVDLIIEGNRIAEIVAHSEAAHERGDQVIDVPDATALPGLIDMHAHVGSGPGEILGRQWLAYGVTTIRDPGSEAYDMLESREAVEAGVRPGPREFGTGPLMDGSRIYYNMTISLDRGAQLDLELDRADRLGYSLIKTYVRLPDRLQKRVIEFAHDKGIPVSSHEIYPAVAFGADHVEHIRGTSRRGYSPKVSQLGRTYDDVIQLLTATGMTITPTIGISGAWWAAIAADSTIYTDPRFPALYGPLVERTRRTAASIGQNAELVRGRFAGMESTIKRVVEGGGRVVAGTDAPIIPYGASLVAEVEAYEAAGLTPALALRTATSVPAEALGMAGQLGTLAPGALADLVIVVGNPLEDIRDLRNATIVIKNGVVYRVEQLLTPPATPPVP